MLLLVNLIMRHNTLKKFPETLSDALQEDRSELEPDEVWQDKIVRYWDQWHEIEYHLRDLGGDLEDVYLKTYTPKHWSNTVIDLLIHHIKIGTESRSGLNIPGRNPIQVDYVGQRLVFRRNKRLGRDHIAYKIDALKTWAKAVTEWAKKSEVLTKKANEWAKKRTS
jgi:hypothetical protein